MAPPTPRAEIQRLCKHFEAEELHAISWDGEKEAVQQSKKVWTTWGGIKRDVESLKAFVERGAYGSLAKLQKLLNKVETQINEWKSTQRLAYEALQSEEKIIQKEVEHLQQRIEEAERSLLGSSSAGSSASDAAGSRAGSDRNPKRGTLGGGDRDLAPEVIAYEEYLAKHGPTGGWDERDHALYLRRLTQFGPKREKECLEKIQNDLPNYDAEEILSHHLWNEGLQYHDRARRRAIEAWRQRRQDEAVADMSDVISETSSVDEKQRSQPMMGGSGAEVGDTSSDLERMKKRAMIMEWKAAKDAEKAAEEARRREEKAAARRTERQRRESRKLELKEKLLEHKMMQEAELSAKKQKKQKSEDDYDDEDAEREARLRKKREMEEKRMQEIENAKRRFEEKERKRKEKLEAMEAQKAAFNALHNSGRRLDVTRPTTAAMERKKATLDDHDLVSGAVYDRSVPIQKIQHKALPSWRRPGSARR
eukprot:TRINITY_DN82839_c0_g1_i2.p1 TRINITY_DN82839_c0_g1~~TRINITY_DN82839_c0_g1_i2.p1  ORF type:complete len:479 (+),score=179.34 TRINITY_DN82839_c0_g1_i2:118-1554(+)